MNFTGMDLTTVQYLTDFAYIVAIVFFVLSLKWLEGSRWRLRRTR